jgi:hypothetical protein
MNVPKGISGSFNIIVSNCGCLGANEGSGSSFNENPLTNGSLFCARETFRNNRDMFKRF